ncbi:MAG: DUF2157 domain-containing protein [Elusimicrobia bacterium]|nr:DUF2157 domain-containing protein [Elusimicrobiota bacterium]
MSYYTRLKNDLAEAAAAGLITSEQASGVWDRVYARRMTTGWKATYLIAAFAGIFIAIGLLLIIAHNWDKFGPVSKIAGFLLLFAAAGYAALAFEEKAPVAVPAEVLWFFMPVIGIGLYAQIFNLSGDPVKPYLVWAALVLPQALLLKRTLTATLVSGLLFLCAFMGAFGRDNVISLTYANRFAETAAMIPWWHWPLAAAVPAAGAAVALYRRCHPALRVIGASLAWVLGLLFSYTPLHVKSPALLLLAATSAVALWIVWTPEEERLESRLPHLAWLATVYGMTFFWHYTPSLESDPGSSAGGALVWVLFGAATASAMLRTLVPGLNDRWRMAFRAALVIPMFSAFMLFGATEQGAKAIAVLANLTIIAAGAGLIVNGAQENLEKRINTGVLFIALLVLTRFFDIFGTLLRSGFGFLGTGLLFAALAYGINRGRKALIETVRK